MTLLSRRTIRLFTFALAASVFSFALNIRAAEQKAPPVDKKAEAKVKKDAAAKEKAAAKEAKAKAKADAEAKAKADADAKAKAKTEAQTAAKTQKPVVKEQPMVKADKPAEQDRSLPLGALTLGARAGDDVVEGYGDFILPVARISSGLLFISPRATFSDDNEEEYNLGLGYRYLVPDKKVIVGGNVYYDYRSTEFNNGFDQLGLGVELLTEWVDARANYYKPEDDRAVAREYDVETISQSEWNAGWGDPYANNNAVLQDYIGPVRRIETLTQHYIEYEQALEGFDAEIGVKLPIPTVSDYADVKVFGGYYYFDAKFGGEDIEGLKGRLEVRAARSIYLDAEVYEDEELYGSDYFVGARMVLPFSVQNFADGRNPFEGGAAGLRTSKQKQAFESRLTEMVMRDLHVQTELSQAIEDVTQQTETHVTKQLNKSPSNTIVLASDVTFVDGDNSGFEDGSAEHPWNTMGEGVGNAVGDTVYVWDAKDPYQENIGLPANMILWGSGCVMAGADGKVFGNGIKPEVVGTALGPTLTVLGDDVTIRGFHIEHEDLFGATPGVDPLFGFDISEAGIYGANVTRTTIACNYIDDCTYGVLLVADNVPVFEATFMNNYAEDCEQDGFHITVGGGTPLLPSMVVNEAYVKFDGDTSVDNDDDGFDVNLAVMDTAVATFKNVTATDNDDDGLDVNLEAFDGGVVLTVDPSTFNENGDDGIQAYLGAEFATLANIAGVTANGNDEDGIDVDMDNGGIGILLIGPDASLMELVSQAFGDDAPDAFEDFLAASGPVTASGNGEDGFDIWMGSSFLSLAGIFDATANENGENGMYGSIYAGEISALLMVPTETLMPLVGTGVDILDMLGLENLPEVPDFTPHGPITANGNGENGIDFLVEADNALMTLMNASASGNKDEAGVEFHIVGHDGIAAGLFAGINANGNDEDGLRGEIESWGGPAAGLFFDFSANGNGDDGLSLDLRAHNNVALFAAASLDPVRYLLGMLNDSDLLDSDITLPGEPFGPVSVSGNGGDGMDVSVRGEGPAVGLVLDVLANGNYGDGIDLNIRSDASDGIGVVGSSDVLFELADLVIGGLGVAPTALPEDFPYMGNLQANGNGGGGVRVRVEGGESGVMLGMGGISANGNTGLNGDFNDGINAVLTSDEGPSDAFIGWVAANGNAGAGVTVRSETEEDAGVMIVNATANGNGGAGVRASVTSRLESIDVFLGGINANGNSNRNVAVLGYAGTNTARVGLMNIQANGSESGPGVYVDVASPNGSVQFGAGSNMYGFLFGPDITELVEDGGIDANGNDDHGMIVNLSARDGVLFAINDVSVNGNGGDGLHVEALSTESAVEGTVGNVDANGNSRDGVDVYAFGGGAGLYSSLYVSNTMANGNASGVKLEVVGASGSAGITASSISANGNTNGNGLAMRVAGLGAAGTAAATAIDTTTDGNENDGVNVQINASGLASFFGQGIRSHGNDNAGVRINAGSGVAAYNLDMGGGLQGSTGQGSISGNANRDLRNAGGGMVMAENNYWGANPPLNSQFAGSVDRDPWLTTDPGP